MINNGKINHEFTIRVHGMTERVKSRYQKKMNFLHKAIYNLSEYLVIIMILILLKI